MIPSNLFNHKSRHSTIWLDMLNVFEAQQSVCEKFDSKFCPLSSNDMIAVAINTIGQLPINGLRYPLLDDNNIGWFVYCGEYLADDNFFEPIHISHLDNLLPEVLPYLALEDHFAFVIDGVDYEDVYKFQ